MSFAAAAVIRIRAFARDQNLRPSTYALRAGLGANTLRGFDGHDWNPRLKTLEALEAVIPSDFRAETVSERESAVTAQLQEGSAP